MLSEPYKGNVGADTLASFASCPSAPTMRGDVHHPVGYDENGWAWYQKKHAVAALALHGQPFGFTRADVEALNNAWCAVKGYHSGSEEDARQLESLRDRIAALLPPEGA